MSDYFSHKLKDDEDVVMFIRKHPATFLVPFLKAAIFIAIPFALMKYLLMNKWLSLVFFGLLIIGFVILLYEWFTWYLDSYLITNQRVIRIKQKGLFSREVRETPYEKIQEVTCKIEGVLATVFNFGSVFVHTMVSKDPLVLASIKRPQEVKEKIIEIQERVEDSDEEGLTAEELVKFIEKIKVGRFTKKVRVTPDEENDRSL